MMTAEDGQNWLNQYLSDMGAESSSGHLSEKNALDSSKRMISLYGVWVWVRNDDLLFGDALEVFREGVLNTLQTLYLSTINRTGDVIADLEGLSSEGVEGAFSRFFKAVRGLVEERDDDGFIADYLQQFPDFFDKIGGWPEWLEKLTE